MNIPALLLCLAFIAVTAVMLYKKYNPQGVLITSGLIMISFAAAMGINPIAVTKTTGYAVFDVAAIINENFISNLSRAGVMIMTIGGYVAFMNKIKATDALVFIAIKPLAVFKKYPYMASVLAIPIGQLLFITTPSAAGLGLLLVASLYPVLVNLGVSRLTALSVISASTIFDQGPGSANTALAAGLIGKTNVEYFLTHQLPLVLPASLFIMTVYYFTNRYYDKKDIESGKKDVYAEKADENIKPDVPLIFSVLPLLPLTLLIVFSEYTGISGVKLGTTEAMLISLIISFIFIILYKRSIKQGFGMLGSFWNGMGNVFSTVVTLIVAAEIFSKGLISLGFIDCLVYGCTHIGFSGIAISVFITMILFLAAMLMGSGNAAFFSFGPLMPDIAGKLGMHSYQMILPMQLSSSMGRAASPIAGVIVAIAGIAGVSPVDLVKRNIIPLCSGACFLMFYHFIFL